MDKNDIIEYVMTTPHNTNRAILSGMLNQLTEGGGSGDDFFVIHMVYDEAGEGEPYMHTQESAQEIIDELSSNETKSIIVAGFPNSSAGLLEGPDGNLSLELMTITAGYQTVQTGGVIQSVFYESDVIADTSEPFTFTESEKVFEAATTYVG